MSDPLRLGMSGPLAVFAAGFLGQALEVEPLREAAWRLKMRIANALGDEDRVIRCYHDCERAFASIGATPAPSTRELLTLLRR
jgi:DNA-binding SARP family transcriptional activator